MLLTFYELQIWGRNQSQNSDTVALRYFQQESWANMSNRQIESDKIGKPCLEEHNSKKDESIFI